MHNKVFYFPSAGRKGYCNPYSLHYKNALVKRFELLDINGSWYFAACIPLFINSFKADIFIFNWIESICFNRFGKIQYFVVLLALFIIKIRRGKIIWMFHNKHPHQGVNYFTKHIHSFLFRNSSLIISHSKEAAEYAKTQTNKTVVYRCHPICSINVKINKSVPKCDILIWGTILPYKGIVEFLIQNSVRDTDLKIIILGKCNDTGLSNEIRKYCSTYVNFENRHADFSEIASYICNCRYVLFPYIGDCVSSSGALIDSIAMHGFVCGPDKGAFKDLQEVGIAITYNSYDELFHILEEPYSIREETRKKFMSDNSWDNFAQFIANELEHL